MACPKCKGRKVIEVPFIGNAMIEAECDKCDGTGETLEAREAANPNLCPDCKGSKTTIVGRLFEADCPTCQGTGECNPDSCGTCNGSKTTVSGMFEVDCPDCAA
jgi:DnaJ-class molecular chaperone